MRQIFYKYDSHANLLANLPSDNTTNIISDVDHMHYERAEDIFLVDYIRPTTYMKTGNNINIGSHTIDIENNSYRFEMKVRIDSAQRRVIFGNYPNSNNNGLLNIEINANRTPRFYLQLKNGTIHDIAGLALTLNVWYKITMTINRIHYNSNTYSIIITSQETTPSSYINSYLTTITIANGNFPELTSKNFALLMDFRTITSNTFYPFDFSYFKIYENDNLYRCYRAAKQINDDLTTTYGVIRGTNKTNLYTFNPEANLIGALYKT